MDFGRFIGATEIKREKIGREKAREVKKERKILLH